MELGEGGKGASNTRQEIGPIHGRVRLRGVGGKGDAERGGHCGNRNATHRRWEGRGSGGTKGDKGALVEVQLLARGESEDGHMGEEGGDDRFGQGAEKGVGIIGIHLPDESLSRAKLNPDRGAAPEPGEEGQGDEEIEEGG